MAPRYTEGLLFPGERKSMQPIAARVPDTQYEAIQNFLTNSPWDWAVSQSRLIDVMKEEASGPRGLFVVDDVPLVKQGAMSPGVARQYCDIKGTVDNCQAIVDSVYLLPSDGANRESLGWCFALDLYLPKAWTDDPTRCQEAGIPPPVVFREKWRIALDQLDRARDHALPHQATIADSGYGDCQEFRTQLRARKEPYVMEVTASQTRVVPAGTALLPLRGWGPPVRTGRFRRQARLPPGVVPASPKEVAAAAHDWVTVRWGEGTKGPLEAQFTRRKIRVCWHGPFPIDEVGWLLLEQTDDGPRSWICWGLNSLRLEELAAIAHRRFFIERFHEEAKMELGMDHFEGRKWRGLNHHLTLVLIAHTFLTLEQLRAQEGTPEEPLPTLAAMWREVVIEVARALVSRVALERTKESRIAWADAVARYWAGAG